MVTLVIIKKGFPSMSKPCFVGGWIPTPVDQSLQTGFCCSTHLASDDLFLEVLLKRVPQVHRLNSLEPIHIDRVDKHPDTNGRINTISHFFFFFGMREMS